jgi:hypothetical protein
MPDQSRWGGLGSLLLMGSLTSMLPASDHRLRDSAAKHPTLHRRE